MKKEIKLLAAALFIAAFGGFCSIGMYNHFNVPQKQIIYQSATPTPTHLVSHKNITENPKSFELAAEKSLNTVVHVKTETRSNQPIDPISYFFYGNRPQQGQPVLSAGSGVIISDDGYIVTNHHVIEGAERIKITLNNKKTYDAELIGS